MTSPSLNLARLPSVPALAWEDCRLLVESVVDYAIFMLDVEGYVATWNRGAERIKGYTASEIVGQHFSTFYTPEDVRSGKPARHLQEAAETGRVEDEGYRLRKDGARFWANVVITALRDEGGNLRGFGKVTRDLSAKQLDAERLRESEQRFHHLVDAVTDYAIFLLDPSGHVVTWNPGAQRIKGYGTDEIVGKHFSTFYTPEDRASGKPERVLATVRREGRFEDEGFRVRKDGTRFWASVIVTALRNAQGEITGFAKVTRDLTEKRAAQEAERKLAQEQLAHAASDDERRRLLSLWQKLPAIVNFFRGPDFVLQFAHPGTVRRLGGRDVIGKPLLVAAPELADRPYYHCLRHVFDTGEPFAERETLELAEVHGEMGPTYWNSVYLPVRDASGVLEGVMTFEQDVTESVIARRELERTNRALSALTGLAIALSSARTVEDVAAVVVDRGMRMAQADTCTLYVMDESGTALELIGHRGVAPEVIAKTSRIGPSDAMFSPMREGCTTWAQTATDYDRMYPNVARLESHAPRARAFWSMPLIAEGRPIGLLGMGFYDERAFSPEERTLVETLGKQCAQAMLRAVRADREDRVRLWLTTTLRSIGDAVITTDVAGNVTLMNAVAEQLTGFSEDDARGRPLQEVFAIFSEETRTASENPVEKVLRHGKVVGLANHTVLRSKAGKEIPIDDSAAPIRDAKGVLFGVVLVFRDVTAEKRNEARRDFLARAGGVLASSLDYRATLRTAAQFAVPQLADWCAVDLIEPGAEAPARVATAHADPDKVEWARQWAETHPRSTNANVGTAQVIRTGRPELYTEVPPQLLETVAADPEHLHFIRQLRIESAMVVPLRVRERTLGAMTFVFAGSGRRYTEQDLAFAEEFARRAAMAVDNALALKQAEDARAEERLLRNEADIANRAKDEFLATASHELRTPLNAILGWTTTLRARKPPADIDRSLAIIERNARRQARLIEDVLDVSRIISGKLSLNLGPANVGEVIQSAIEAVGPAAEAKQIRIEADVDDSLTIRADTDRLQQIVWNLLANAVKFTPKGGRVAVRGGRHGGTATIVVTDTGEGIPPQALPLIFEPFRQADASTTRKHGGLGLGLAIVRQLVVAHGGSIEAQSQGLGCGATFTVTLPATAPVPASGHVRAAPGTATIDAGEGQLPRLDGLCVLIVEDEDDARDVVADVLRDRGASVVTAASAQEALDQLSAAAPVKPDVIVSDIGMPDMDGYAFLRRVRSLPLAHVARTPAVALTAYARREDAQRAFAAGFQMHIAKPVEPMRLVAIVANLAGLSLQ